MGAVLILRGRFRIRTQPEETIDQVHKGNVIKIKSTPNLPDVVVSHWFSKVTEVKQKWKVTPPAISKQLCGWDPEPPSPLPDSRGRDPRHPPPPSNFRSRKPVGMCSHPSRGTISMVTNLASFSEWDISGSVRSVRGSVPERHYCVITNHTSLTSDPLPPLWSSPRRLAWSTAISKERPLDNPFF